MQQPKSILPLMNGHLFVWASLLPVGQPIWLYKQNVNVLTGNKNPAKLESVCCTSVVPANKRLFANMLSKLRCSESSDA
jgi:hypothetical protein